MKERNDQPLPQDKDRHLDVPAEANRDKHINFLDTDQDSRREDVNEDSPFFVPSNTPLKREVDKESGSGE